MPGSELHQQLLGNSEARGPVTKLNSWQGADNDYERADHMGGLHEQIQVWCKAEQMVWVRRVWERPA